MMNSEQECLKLLDILSRAIESNKGPLIGADDRFWYAEGLAIKFFIHAVSVLYLCRGTNMSDFPSAPLKFIDPASISILTRAAFEAFLTFHYVFSAPPSIEEQSYRYWSYKIAGLAERQDFPASALEHKQKLADEKKVLYDLHNKLGSNAIFRQLTEIQRSRVLKGEWRWLPEKSRQTSWRQIATDAGLAKLLSSDIYGYLSGYAHSGSLSILQIKQSLQNKEQLLLIGPSMIVINISAANIIHEYCALFPRTEKALFINTDGTDTIARWIRVGQTLYIESPADSENTNI